VDQKVVDLGKTETGQSMRVSCFYYRDFLVKEIDLGEVGAAQLSVLPYDAKGPRPKCHRANAANERVVSAKDWAGYFRSVQGRLVLFDAEDGWEAGSLGFAAFSADTGRKIFDDAAVGPLRFETAGTTTRTRVPRGLLGGAGPAGLLGSSRGPAPAHERATRLRRGLPGRERRHGQGAM
jgi:hypothetical protein